MGPEFPREGVGALRASIDEALPSIVVAPMYLRGRAIEDAVREAVEDTLSDDATVVVVVPNPVIADASANA